MAAPKVSGVLVGDDDLVANLDKLGDLTLALNLLAAAEAGALLIINSAKGKVRKKTRTLARSIHSERSVVERNYVELDIGTNLEYAAIHEFGGTIVPKKAQFLAIPVTGGAEAVGSPLNYPGDLVPIFWTDGGSGVLMDESGTVQYILSRSTTITPQPYMRPALDEQGKNALEEIGEYMTTLLTQIRFEYDL